MSEKLNHYLNYWLPPLMWMALISLLSTDHFSGQQTSRFMGPLLRFFVPEIADTTIASMQLVVRKAGHLTEYGILFLLWYRALNASQPKPLHRWRPRCAVICLVICVLYAASDEWHQSWTSQRVGTPVDVGIDTLGATMALGWVCWRTRRREKE